MPRAAPLQSALNAGEFSPRLIARTDFDKYPLGCSVLENFLVLPQGGATRRPGSLFIAEVADSSKRHRLLPFVFSTIQSYILELGNLTFRFYKDQGRIVTINVTGTVANGTFDANVTSWDDRDSGGTAASTWNAGGYMQLLGDGTEYAWREQAVTVTTALAYTVLFRIRGVPGDLVEVRVGAATLESGLFGPKDYGTGWHAITFTSSGTTAVIGFRHNKARAIGVDDVSILDNSPMQLTSPYTEAQLAAIHRVQSADVLYLAHSSHPPYKLSRYGHTSWSLEEIDFLDGPYLDQNVTATTLTMSGTGAVGGTVTVTASAVTGINGNTGFQTTDVGRLIRRLDGTTWGYGRISGWTSTTVVTLTVYRVFAAATAVATWRLGAWSGTTGYPHTLGFFEQRLCYAATTTFPQRLWLSQSADFENHEPDSVPSAGGARQQEADDALDYTLAGNEVDSIQWLSAGKNLLLGTLGGEWRVTSSGPNIQFDDIDAKIQTSFGSAAVQPVKMRSRNMFLQRARRKLFEFLFDFATDSFEAFDQNLLSEHITKGGIEELAYQQEPDSVLWTVRGDGQMPTLTYQPEQRVVGWARQYFGGSYLAGDAVAESVAVIPGTGADEVWAIVKRTINSATERYVEVVQTSYETGDDHELAVYCDSAILLDNPITITGATSADPVVITATAHGFSNGDRVRITEIIAEEPGTDETSLADELNWQSFIVADKTDNTFELTDADGADIDGSDFSAYATGGEVRLKVNSVSGADHLALESVTLLADGAVHPAVTVTAGGVIALDGYYSKVVAGLPYDHAYESLKWEAGAPGGTAQGQIKRIDGVTLFLLNSMNGSIGPDEDNLLPLSFRDVTDLMDAAVPLFTGDLFTEFDGDYGTDTRVYIEGSDPVPFTLIALSPRLKTNPK